jgi:hypothetical protein
MTAIYQELMTVAAGSPELCRHNGQAEAGPIIGRIKPITGAKNVCVMMTAWYQIGLRRERPARSLTGAARTHCAWNFGPQFRV